MSRKKNSSSPGDVLVAARRKRKLKRVDVSKELFIKIKLLKAFDDWKFEDMPKLSEPVYISLRKYARSLEVNPSELERQLPAEYQPAHKPFKAPRRLFFASRFGYMSGMIAVTLAFMGFLGWRTIQDNAIPDLSISSPAENAVVEESKAEINGKTSEGAQVFINGVTVPVDTNGEFSGTVVLQEGPNTVEIRAINAFARERTIERVIVRTP